MDGPARLCLCHGRIRIHSHRPPPCSLIGHVVLAGYEAFVVAGMLPNKRLKLAGGDRSQGSGVLCTWRVRTDVQQPCAGGRVARSLSAIR